jgi:hypothetical protein
MKRTIITVTAVLAVLGLAILFGAPKGQNFNSSAAIAAPAPVPAAVPMPNRCPNIHEALEALRSAEHEMREGRHDFCGHKVEAMRATHDAIEQLRLAEDCDRCR